MVVRNAVQKLLVGNQTTISVVKILRRPIKRVGYELRIKNRVVLGMRVKHQVAAKPGTQIPPGINPFQDLHIGTLQEMLPILYQGPKSKSHIQHQTFPNQCGKPTCFTSFRRAPLRE